MKLDKVVKAVIIFIVGMAFNGATIILGIRFDLPPFLLILLVVLFTFGTIWGIVEVAKSE